MDGKIVNLTPHAIRIKGRMVDTEIPSSGIARLNEMIVDDGLLGGIPVIEQIRGPANGLPDPQDGIYYIVSRPVFDSLPHRKDLLAVGEPIRDEKGNVIAAKNLVRR